MGESTFTLVTVSNMLLTAFLVFIRTIPTVIRAVTHPVAGNAAVVPTFKLGGCTKFVCKGSQKELNIWEIYPNHKSCFSMWSWKWKKKGLLFLACYIKKTKTIRLTTVCLISSVLTVILLIAGPAHRYAATTRTGKEVDWAFKFPFIWKNTEKNIIWNE